MPAVQPRLLIVCARRRGSSRQAPSHPHDEWRPFCSGCLVFGITVDWELWAMWCERGPLGPAFYLDGKEEP